MTCYKECVTDGVVPCPTCDFPVPPDQVGCPQCRAERHRKRRPFYLMLAGLAAAIAWQSPRLMASWRQFQAEVDAAQHPGRDMKYVGDGSTGTVPEVRTSSAVYLGGDSQSSRPSPFPHSVSVSPSPGPAAPGSGYIAGITPTEHTPAEAPDAAPPDPPENAPELPMRRVYGVVYDLKTLKAVPQARVVISMRGGQHMSWTATTNPSGHYKVDVIDGPGVSLIVSATVPGYRPGALEDSDPPYRQRSAKARRELAEQTTDSDLDAFNLAYRSSQNLIPLDLVLLPEESPK